MSDLSQKTGTAEEYLGTKLYGQSLEVMEKVYYLGTIVSMDRALNSALVRIRKGWNE